jgi:transposase
MRRHDLREVCNGLRFIVRGGLQWRLVPHDLPPGWDVYQQTRRWLDARVFATIVHDLRVLLRLGAGRTPEPTAAILDSRTVQSTPESGGRTGYDGPNRRKGSKTDLAVATRSDLLALHATPANAQDRDQVERLAAAVQEVTVGTVEVGFVDQGYTGEHAAADAARQGIRLKLVKLPEAKRGFVLLPRRWVVERSFAWTGRFRHLAWDYEGLHTTLEGFPYVAFALLALNAVRPILAVL